MSEIGSKERKEGSAYKKENKVKQNFVKVKQNILFFLLSTYLTDNYLFKEQWY